MIGAGLTITYDRSKVIGLSFQFDDDQRVLLIPYPELEILGNIDGIARPFQYEVYIFLNDTVDLIALTTQKIRLPFFL